MNIDQTILQKVNEYFKDNESTKQYIDIISTALDRQKPMQNIIDTRSLATVRRKRKEQFKFYTEVHHIIPESIDPLLEKYKPNWIILTGEEHFTCHKLLVDMCIDKDHHYKMCEAYGKMCKDNRGWTVTAEEYAIAKKLATEAQSIRMKGKALPIIASLKSIEARSEPVECYIIVDGKEIILDKFDSIQEAADKTKVDQSSIIHSTTGKINSSGTYNLSTKRYSEIKLGPSTVLPNDNHPTTYRLHWRKENSTSTIVIEPRELYECYIIVDDKEIILDKFVTCLDAADKTNGNSGNISGASSGNKNYSGTYNLSTKQYNENKFGTKSVLPNNNYLTTYRCKWRKIKE